MKAAGSMDVRLPHRVVYKVGEIVPVEEVIGTLQANQLLTSELGQMLERLFPGLIVEKAKLEVRTIETGSLREYFFLAFVVTFQEDLKEEVPALLEQWAGLPVSDQYDSLVTAIVMLMLFYGADYIYLRFI